MSQTIPPQPLDRTSLLSPHRIIVRITIVLVAILALGAIVWEVRRVTAPPSLTVSTPVDNLLTNETTVELTGVAAPESAVTVNGALVPTRTDGSFKEKLDLRSGVNIITISAVKKFAKPSIVYRRVVVTKD